MTKEIVLRVSPSEFFDKLTIAVNKVYNVTEEDAVAGAMADLIRLCSHVSNLQGAGFTPEDFGRCANGLMILRDTNKLLWNLEEEVRATEDSAERLKISDEIRDQNWERHDTKAWIDEQFDALTEVKDYWSNESSESDS